MATIRASINTITSIFMKVPKGLYSRSVHLPISYLRIINFLDISDADVAFFGRSFPGACQTPELSWAPNWTAVNYNFLTDVFSVNCALQLKVFSIR